MQHIDQSKFERQKEGADRWRFNKGIGTLNYVPRFGKTFTAINFIINPHLKAKEDNYVIILVPSEIVARVWHDNLKSYCDAIDRIEIRTINSCQNETAVLKCSLLIVDELHKFVSDERRSYIDGTFINHIYRLGLTGTYPFDKEYSWLHELYPIVDTIEEREAIDKGWISNFIEYNILLELSDKDKITYKKLSEPIAEILDLFRNKYKYFLIPGGTLMPDDFSLIQACYSGMKAKSLDGNDIYITYDKICNTLAGLMGWHRNLDISDELGKQINDYWSPNAIHEASKKFMDFIRKRNNILINNEVKLNVVKEIVSKYHYPTIIFNESTDFADAITEAINNDSDYHNAICYHSNIESRPIINPATNSYYLYTTGERKGEPKVFGKKTIKNMVIEGTRTGIYTIISTAKALDEGLDIPNLEVVICTAGTTNPMTYKQRTARGKTVDIYNPNKTTKIFNLVFNDFLDDPDSEGNRKTILSRDLQKLKARQRESGNHIYWISELSQVDN